ncbi:unnamed protein product [Caenorhabditis brenneri]
MAVQLILTEEMIDCFHICAKRSDYQKLFNDYPSFFVILVENVDKVKFPDDSIWQVIAKNSEHLLDILRQWHTGTPLFSDEMLAMGEQFPEFVSHFWDLDSVKNWNNFYTKYSSTADIMITCARNEGVLDFKIECKGVIFDYFEKRDKFLEHGQKLRNELMSEIREVLKLSEAKIEEDGQKLKKELMERVASLEQHMENRISETNEKIDSMNRKLAHFNSSFNEKFNSLGDQFNLVQLDKKIEALSIKSNNGEDLNQFLAKIGEKFNEQQVEMSRRADWMSKKMEKMMEKMMATVGPASSTQLTSPAQDNNIGTHLTSRAQLTAPVQDNAIETSQNEPSVSQSGPTDAIVRPTDQVDEPTSEDEELQKMEEKFQKDLAEQNRVFEAKLRVLQDQRRMK